ncbi:MULTISPECIES: zinc-binding dehydrogenase [Citrobacter]|uniref:zinc-binding dehydrogenase n=1 Tax=Citrobacter TaxID=544 RepID=UPI0027E57117|nr:zinc-binding dehydrogenase [Citrobacter portucalensis]
MTTANAAKHGRVRPLGADQAIDYMTEDFAAVATSITDNKGINVILEYIGAPYFGRHVNALDFDGHLIWTGIMKDIKNAKIPMDRVLYRHL